MCPLPGHMPALVSFPSPSWVKSILSELLALLGFPPRCCRPHPLATCQELGSTSCHLQTRWVAPDPFLLTTPASPFLCNGLGTTHGRMSLDFGAGDSGPHISFRGARRESSSTRHRSVQKSFFDPPGLPSSPPPSKKHHLVTNVESSNHVFAGNRTVASQISILQYPWHLLQAFALYSASCAPSHGPGILHVRGPEIEERDGEVAESSLSGNAASQRSTTAVTESSMSVFDARCC